MDILEAIQIHGYKKEVILKQYNNGRTAFYSIIKQKDKLFQDKSTAARSRKSSKAIPPEQKELESRIIRWISEMERKGMLVGVTQIKEQALKFFDKMQIRDLKLKFTDGWFRHLKGLFFADEP